MTQRQKELLKQCKYYKGEESCPLGGDYSYKTLISNPAAYWWHVEEEVVNNQLFERVDIAVKCKIYKHMEMSPLTEEECLASYGGHSI